MPIGRKPSVYDSEGSHILSISVVSSASLLEQALEAMATSTNKTATASAAAVSTTSTAASSTSSTSPLDVLTQDMVALLKALTSGDVTGAKSDLAKLKTDLAAQQSAGSTTDATSSLTKDVTSLLKDLTSGNTSSAKTDIAKVQKDLQSGDASFASSSQTTNPLDTLISTITASLNTGGIQGALQDLASYLVQNGQGSGSLVDTSA